MVNATETPGEVEICADDGSWFRALVRKIDVAGGGPTREEALNSLRLVLESKIQGGNLTPEQATLVSQILPGLPKL